MEIFKFCFWINTDNEIKTQSINWDKVFTNQKSDRKFVLKFFLKPQSSIVKRETIKR
jgi:hypothetical protein